MFKNIWYWSNKKWALIYGACILLFGLQIYCYEVNNVPEEKEVIEIKDAKLFMETVKAMDQAWGTHITIEKAERTVDSTKLLIDKLKAQKQALKKIIKMPKVVVNPM